MLSILLEKLEWNHFHVLLMIKVGKSSFFLLVVLGVQTKFSGIIFGKFEKEVSLSFFFPRSMRKKLVADKD